MTCPTNSPKQILADLIPVLLQKISQSPPSAFPQIIQSLQNNLNNKQIVIYSRDSRLRKAAGGNLIGPARVADSDRDYLSVVSSNLAPPKPTFTLTKKSSHDHQHTDDGSITDEVDITRTNKMPDLPDSF